MAFRVLAFHYPRPEHRVEMVARIRRAAEVIATCEGFVAAECWVEVDGEAVVGVGAFESSEQWSAAMEKVAAAEVDFAFDERERKPRSVQFFVEAEG